MGRLRSWDDSELALQPAEIKVKVLVLPRETCPWAKRWGGSKGPHQLSLCGDNEVQVPETHVCTESETDAVMGHLRPKK